MTAVRDRDPDLFEELELRILLERGTPKLPTPDGRLQQVRERIARRRLRRRTAGAAAAAVTALVLAGTLMPQALRGDPEPVQPAGPAPSLSTGGTTAVRFPDLGNLTLRLPADWHALAEPEDLLHKAPARGFAGTQQLTAHDRPCPASDQRECLPVQALQPGHVLLTLAMESSAGLRTKVQVPPVLYRQTVQPACRAIRGGSEYSTLLGALPNPDSGVVSVSLCAGVGTSAKTVDDVRRMLAGARFGDDGAAAPPTAASTPPPKRATTGQSLTDPTPGNPR
ncbi:hypothetical protein [Streptomyces sp. NPDC020681]|uniref:hypothetical protein n=1 Tax=Streptomyces sp. NPDC020681 TaxID=3365083 RepID=UPI003790A1AC